MIRVFGIEELFTIKSGDFHATKELDEGDVPLISCGDINNGLVGYFDIPEDKRYSNTITVAYNGQPLTAKFHPYIFGAKDDVAVLLPKREIQQKTLVYIATLLNQQTWRYSYGRKCFKGKLKNLTIPLPVSSFGGIDETYISNLFSFVHEHLPQKNEVKQIPLGDVNWRPFIINEIFELRRGDFHSLSKLDEGDVPTVSRVSDNNGVVGYYNPPKNARIYQLGAITVSTVTGGAFVQLKGFIATDNVVICIPRIPLKLTSLFFIQLMINQVKWRYSYGRQCYKTKFAQTKIYLPVDNNDTLDEEFMKRVIKNTSYWHIIQDYYLNQ